MCLQGESSSRTGHWCCAPLSSWSTYRAAFSAPKWWASETLSVPRKIIINNNHRKIMICPSVQRLYDKITRRVARPSGLLTAGCSMRSHRWRCDTRNAANIGPVAVSAPPPSAGPCAKSRPVGPVVRRRSRSITRPSAAVPNRSVTWSPWNKKKMKK